ncbi:hypothetical protein ONZ45_g153 [Pleurotus djamor]|nr:hypothetical protein ONZ45_g153 [Pleurotus djamor]
MNSTTFFIRFLPSTVAKLEYISVNNPNYPVTWVYSEGEVSALCDPPLYVIKTYLARSRTSPLNVDLSFLFTDWEDNFPSSVPRNVIRLLHTHMDHTKSISIYIPESFDAVDPKEPLYPALIAAPNVLETLHLAHKSQLLSPFTSKAFPLLKNFTWTGAVSKALKLPIPWTQLRHLALVYNDFSHIIDSINLLKRVPNLTSLEASIIDRCDEGHCAAAQSMKPIGLPRLASLNIKGTPPGLCSLLALVKSPQLTELTFRLYTPLGMEENEEKMICNALAKLFKSTQLRALSLDDLPISSPIFLRLLKYVSPTLEHLEVQDFPRFNYQVFNALTVPLNERSGDSSSVLCPHLNSLHLKSCTFRVKIPHGSIATMVASRLSSNPLKDLWVIVTAGECVEDSRRLRGLNSTGQLPHLRWEELGEMTGRMVGRL